MLCDRCHKNEACIHIRGLAQNGAMMDLNLCARCAIEELANAEKNLNAPSAKILKKVLEESKGELMDLLQKQMGELSAAELLSQPNGERCEHCQTPVEDVLKSGRLHCPACLDKIRGVLADRLELEVGSIVAPDELLEASLERSSQLKRQIIRKTILQLEEQLRQEADAERYEKAAELKAQLDRLRGRTLVEEGENAVVESEAFRRFGLSLNSGPKMTWSPDFDRPGPIVRIASAIVFRRNLKVPGLPPYKAAEKAVAEEVAATCRRMMAENELLRNLTEVDLVNLDTIRKFDIESSGQAQVSFFANRFGRVLAVSPNGRIVCRVNDIEHFTLEMWSGGPRLAERVAPMIQFAKEMSTSADWQLDDKFGYIASRFAYCGTGLNAQVLFHLPALCLCGQLPQVINACRGLGCVLEEWHSGQQNESNLYMMRAANVLTTSLNEQAELLESAGNILENKELQFRNVLAGKGERRIKMIDAVARAYGLATTARLMDLSECRKITSMLWLGMDMNMLPQMTLTDIFRLQQTLEPFTLNVNKPVAPVPQRVAQSLASSFRNICTPRSTLSAEKADIQPAVGSNTPPLPFKEQDLD